MCLAGHSVFDAPLEGVWIANRDRIAFVQDGLGNVAGAKGQQTQSDNHYGQRDNGQFHVAAPPASNWLVTRETCNG